MTISEVTIWTDVFIRRGSNISQQLPDNNYLAGIIDLNHAGTYHPADRIIVDIDTTDRIQLEATGREAETNTTTYFHLANTSSSINRSSGKEEGRQRGGGKVGQGGEEGETSCSGRRSRRGWWTACSWTRCTIWRNGREGQQGQRVRQRRPNWPGWSDDSSRNRQG
jgi:hypothetical protein